MSSSGVYWPCNWRSVLLTPVCHSPLEKNIQLIYSIGLLAFYYSCVHYPLVGPPLSCHIFRIWNRVWYRVGGTSQLRNRWMDEFLDGWMDAWREEWEDGWMTMKVSYSQELLSAYLSYPG